MTADDLRAELSAIIQAEEGSPPDWQRVEIISMSLIKRLKDGPEPEFPDKIYHFIDDFDIRQRDHRYAEAQRQMVRDFLAKPNEADTR